jgi:hypothetical protein
MLCATVERVLATYAMLAPLETLKQKHGPLMFRNQ